MAIESKLIRVRRGTAAEFEARKSKIISGEFAVVTDLEEAYFSPWDGKSVRLATEKDVSKLEESEGIKPTGGNGTKGQALLTNGDGTTRWGDVANGIVSEVTGESIAVSDSINSKLKGLSVYGKSTQDGTPTPDTPIEIVNVGDSGSIEVEILGKNLIENEIATQTVNGITFTVNADGSITANGTSTALTAIHIGEANIKAGVPYALSGCPGNTGTELYRMDLRISKGVLYVPNVIDSGNGAVFTPDEDVTVIVAIRIPSGATIINKTFYPMLRLANIDDAVYEPYKEKQSIVLPVTNGLPGIPVADASIANYTDAEGSMWCCDEIDLERGVYVQRVAKTQISSSYASWAKSGTNVDRYYCSIGALTGIDKSLYNNILCTHFIISSAGEAVGEIKANAGSIGFAFSEKDASTLDEFKTFLDENAVYAWYILETPIETELSADEVDAFKILYSNYLTTTVFNDAGAWMSVKYIADTKAYIDNKFAELQALIVNNV